jgi:hypothetical protein
MAHPVLSVDRLIVSPHAMSRALDMRGLDELEIREALFRPDVVEFSRKHESWNFVAGRVCCGVHVDSSGVATVLTVLWRDRADWRRDFELGEYGGRSARG